MLKSILTFFLILLIPKFVLSQKQDKLWMMGYDCCGPNFSGVNMDFRSGTLVINAVTRHFNFADTNAQLCDSAGNILFYSNGIYVANALNDTMLNGDNLNPSNYTFAHSIHGLYLPQGELVIPMPGNGSKYYLFHETSDDRFNTYATYYLYYSIIDMTLAGGLGGVINKNTVLLHDTLVEGELTACKHANGRDWWLIAHRFECDTSYKFLITPTGIQGPWIDEMNTWRTNYFGQAVFSQDGSKYAYFEPHGGLDIFDFDRCSGNFSNQIHINMNDSAGAGGAAFSSSGRFLFISTIYHVYQFDLFASDIASSRITVAYYDGYESGRSPTVFYQQQLGPDGKIYINSSSTVFDYHVINYPDSAGLACDLQQHSIHLPGFSITLPNHPNYYLGAKGGTVCDSLITDVPFIHYKQESFNIFPNPVKNLLYITQGRKEIIKLINIYNSIGQKQVFNYSSFNNGEYLEVNTSSLSAGIYFLEMLSDKKNIVKRFVKE